MEFFEGSLSITRFQVRIFVSIICIGIILTGYDIYAQPCNRKGAANKDTQMYDQPPVVITGKGLVYGRNVGTLKNGIIIYICQEAKSGFGFSTQQWYRIAYWNNEWSFAWVFAGDINLASAQILPRIEQKFVLISQAWAESGLPSQRDPISPPPGQEPPSLPRTSVPQPQVSFGPLYEFYIWLFASMLIGMIAKALYDIVNSVEVYTIKEHLLSIIAPILVSPMVFMSLMQSAELSVDGKNSIIILFLAFQNGFFWKTVFDRKKM